MIPSCKRTSDDLPDFFSGPSSKIQVQRSKLHGYGVFAIDDIQADELIEESRMLRTGLRANYSHDTVLRDFFGVYKNATARSVKITDSYSLSGSETCLSTITATPQIPGRRLNSTTNA